MEDDVILLGNGYKVVENIGREQPWTLWKGDRVILFAEDIEVLQKYLDGRLKFAISI